MGDWLGRCGVSYSEETRVDFGIVETVEFPRIKDVVG